MLCWPIRRHYADVLTNHMSGTKPWSSTLMRASIWLKLREPWRYGNQSEHCLTNQNTWYLGCGVLCGYQEHLCVGDGTQGGGQTGIARGPKRLFEQIICNLLWVGQYLIMLSNINKLNWWISDPLPLKQILKKTLVWMGEGRGWSHVVDLARYQTPAPALQWSASRWLPK